MSTGRTIVEEARRRLSERDQARAAHKVDQADAQATYEARVARERAEHERLRGPQVAPEELARRAAEERDEVGRLRNLLDADVSVRRRGATAALTQAVGDGDLDAALDAQAVLDALRGVETAARTRLRQLGEDPDRKALGGTL